MHSPQPGPPILRVANRLLRLSGPAAGWVLTLATLYGVVRTWRGGSDTLLLVTGSTWAVYGIIAAVFRSIDRIPEAIARVLMNVGLRPAATGFSGIEAMAARGAHTAAAEAYRARANDLWIRRTLAELYETALGDAGRAMVELRRLLDGYPDAPQAPHVRRTLKALRAAHFATPTPGEEGP